MKELLKQITPEKFRKSSFSIYNFIEEKGYIDELKGMFSETYSIEDFEYMRLELTEPEGNAIYCRMSSVLNRFKELKKFIEHDIQEEENKPKAMLFIEKDDKKVILVKLKEFDLVERMKEKIANGDTPKAIQ